MPYYFFCHSPFFSFFLIFLSVKCSDFEEWPRVCITCCYCCCSRIYKPGYRMIFFCFLFLSLDHSFLTARMQQQQQQVLLSYFLLYLINYFACRLLYSRIVLCSNAPNRLCVLRYGAAAAAAQGAHECPRLLLHIGSFVTGVKNIDFPHCTSTFEFAIPLRSYRSALVD